MRSTALSILICLSSAAADYCVRTGATGSGTGADWDNAYTFFPSTLDRGSTYYVADGDYTASGLYDFDDAESGTSVITIRKATEASHGPATGWDSAYGDGQAVFAPLRIVSGYHAFTGVSRTGLDSGYGIKIDNSTAASAFRALSIGKSGGPSWGDITVSYVEVAGTASTDDTYDDQCVQVYAGSGTLSIDHCWIHNAGQDLIHFSSGGGSGLVVEYCLLEENDSSPSSHGQGIAMVGVTDVNIRYNVFKDIEGTAFIATPSSVETFFTSVDIYGNLFFRSLAPVAYLGAVGNGCISTLENARITTLGIYNNTVANLETGVSGAPRILRVDTGALITTVLIKNNLWYDCSSVDSTTIPAGVTSWDWSHQAYYDTDGSADADANKQTSSGDPFTGYASEAFSLSSGTTAGASLGAEYEYDPATAQRGLDGTWDRGAYEYNSGASASSRLLSGDVKISGTVIIR